MAAISVENPFTVITDDDGTALEDGYVYIGTVSLEPQANPITAYWDQALSIPAAQPIRTVNGYFSQGGSPGKLYVDADDYSITVKNKNSVVVYISLVNSNIPSTIPSSSVTGQFDASRIDFEQTGTGFVSRTIENKFFDIVSVKDFGAVGDGVADDTVEIQAALDSISEGTVYLPAGTYNISATLNINTTKIKLMGDGNQASIIEVQTGVSGSALHLIDPSGCVLEDFQIDVNNKTSIDGLYIIDGINITINRILIKNCINASYKISNVDNCVFTECGSHATSGLGATFHFLASAALDAASTINGIRCKVIDCYTSTTSVVGSIYSDQVDTSSIDVLVERFKEISNTGPVSVDTNTVHLNHVVKLVDCLFLKTTPGEAIVFQETSVIRTPGISITGADTPILHLAPVLQGANYSGMLIVTASSLEFHDTSSHSSAVYALLITSRSSTSNNLILMDSDGQVAGASASEPSFTFKMDQTNEHLEATPIGSTSGTFYFYITQLGGLKLTNI